MNRRPPACKAGALPAELQPHPLVFFSPCGGALRFRLGHVRLCTFPASKPCASCRVRKNPARMSGARNTSDKVVGLERLELSTSRLSGVRSNHLSYRPPAWSFCILAALRCAFALVMYFFVHSLRQKLAFLARIQKSRRSVRQGKPRHPWEAQVSLTLQHTLNSQRA